MAGRDGSDSRVEALRRENAALKAEVDALRRRFEASELAHGERLLRAGLDLSVAQADLEDAATAREALRSATGYAIFTTDANGAVSSWNDGAERLLGWPAQEMVGRSADAIFTPEDRDTGVPEREMRAARERGAAEDERWHVRRDGSRFFASGLLMPLRDGSGGFVKILRDRTEHLRAERNQLRRLEQMRALAEAARAIVGAADLHGTLQAITDAARQIVGAHQAVCSLTRGSDWSQAINAVSLSQKYGGFRDYAAATDGGGIYAWVCEGNRTVRMTQGEIEAHPRWRAFGSHGGAHPPLRGWLAAALVGADGRNLGLIQLSDKVDGEFDEVDEAIVVQLAGFAASAIERAHAEEERREAEARLAVERELLDAVIRQAPVGISITEAGTGRAVALNDKATAILGHGQASEDIERYGRYGAIHPDGRAYEVEDYPTVRALRQGAPIDKEEMLYRRGGPAGTEVRRLLVSSAPVRDGSGAVVAAVTVFIDVEEQRRAEEALRESEGRLRLAVEAGRLAVWELDIPTDTLTPSPELNRLLGFPADARPTAEELRAHYAPGERERLQAVARDVIARGDRFAEVEYRFVGPDGRMRWLMLRAEIHRDGSGAPTRYVGVVLDVSERKAVELALAEAHAEAETRAAETAAILSQLAEGVIVTDPEGRITFVNEAAARLHGAGRLDATPESYSDAYRLFREDGSPYPPGDLPLTRAVREGEVVQDARWRIRPADGREVIAVGSARPILSPEGERIGAVLTVRDDTARAHAEAELQRLNATLEARVVERSAELLKAEEALRQAQKMEAVGQLTGGVAHDFNNLLTIIKSSTDLLRRPDLPDERRRRYVDAIADTVDRAAKLTGQLLAFARRQALKPEVFDVADRVRGLSDMLRTIVGSRIRIAAEAGCDRCYVEADASQFDTAVVNLAVNARDAMEGEGDLRVSVRRIDGLPPIRGQGEGPGAFVAVSLSDTGCGIPPERIGQIFEPFFTTKEVGKGTGLGLSQVYGFAKQSGGDIAVESEVGRGSTFTLYLPRTAASPDGSVARGAGREAEGGRGRRVLVVEDNPEVGAFSTQLLQDLGYDTVWASDAAQALRVLEERPGWCDVVFSDVVMPGMNGVDLALEIRRRYPGLPVILTSGYAHVLAEEGRHGFELLHKPYAVEDLSRVLRRTRRVS